MPAAPAIAVKVAPAARAARIAARYSRAASLRRSAAWATRVSSLLIGGAGERRARTGLRLAGESLGVGAERGRVIRRGSFVVLPRADLATLLAPAAVVLALLGGLVAVDQVAANDPKDGGEHDD